MRHTLGSSWSILVVAIAASAPFACTTGVTDSFESFTGPPLPPANTDGVTTFETGGSTVPTDDGVVTMGGSDDATEGETMPATTEPGNTTDPGDTTAAEGCNPPCPAGEECMAGACVPMGGGCNDVPGNYEGCLGAGNVVDTAGCGGGNVTCITGGDPVIAGVCSQTDCVDACDCPAAPGTGNPVVTCDAITGNGTNFCYLDCAGGETCPTGMICFGNLACIWEGEGAAGEPYGDCFNNGPSICGVGGVCLSDDVGAPTVSVCTQDCVNVGDCPAAPPGGTALATCQDVTDDGINECVIDCSAGSCPTGMACFAGFLCMWN